MLLASAVAGHLQIRLSQIAGGTEVSLRHRVLGIIDENHRDGMVHGWDHFLQSLKRLAE